MTWRKRSSSIFFAIDPTPCDYQPAAVPRGRLGFLDGGRGVGAPQAARSPSHGHNAAATRPSRHPTQGGGRIGRGGHGVNPMRFLQPPSVPGGVHPA